MNKLKPDWPAHFRTGNCPYCSNDSTDLCYGAIDVDWDAETVDQTVTCPTCLNTWLDVFPIGPLTGAVPQGGEYIDREDV